MIQHFEISNQHIQEVSLGKGNWLVLKDATKEEQEEIIKNYRLPQNILSEATMQKRFLAWNH